MIITTEAIVLHTRRYGDSSKIATLFTQELGMVAVVAKGARTPKSAFGSALEPLGHIRATIYHGRNRDMHTISSAETVALRRRLTSSLAGLESALLVADVVMRTQAREQPDARVFTLLADTFRMMDGAEEPALYAMALAARLHLAAIMGFGLPGSPPPDTSVVRIDVTDGTVRADGAEGFRLSRTAYEHVRTALAGTYEAIPAHDRIELESFLSLYFSYHLDRRVPTKAPYISG